MTCMSLGDVHDRWLMMLVGNYGCWECLARSLEVIKRRPSFLFTKKLDFLGKPFNFIRRMCSKIEGSLSLPFVLTMMRSFSRILKAKNKSVATFYIDLSGIFLLSEIIVRQFWIRI